MRNCTRPPRLLLPVIAVAIVASLVVSKGEFTLPTSSATAIAVNTSADELNSDGDCSLREAIVAANTDTLTDACPAGSGADTITVPAGTYTLTIAGAGEDAALTGDLDITADVTINGAGARTTTVHGGSLDRVFHIDPGAASVTATISGMTIRNGNDGGGAGGGVRNDGTLTLTAVTIDPNVSTSVGGGIFNTGTLTMSDSNFNENFTTGNGGALASLGLVTLTNSTLSDNSANLGGGAIFGNGATINLNNVTITDNRADADVNTTGDGGGVSAVGGAVNVKNTIIAGNFDLSPGAEAPDCSATLNSQGYNLIQSTAGCTIAGDTTGNITGVGPNLGTMGNNGGTTDTHALLTGSPAIDAGNPATPGSGGNACEATDQRGKSRPADGDGVGGARCDMGAFELHVENIDPDSDGSQYAWGENAGWLNAEPSGNGGPGVIVTDTDLTGWMWGENIGWINMSCQNNGTCGAVNYGVTNDGSGNLAGYAWGENVGWISFSCDNVGTCGAVDYGVTIDGSGEFNGYAWGENIGWISFSCQNVGTCGAINYGVKTSWSSPCIDRDGDSTCDAVNDPDDDGCATSEEAAQADDGFPPTLPGETGGYDSTLWYDFYDVPIPVKPDAVGPNGKRNKAINFQDVLGVLAYVGTQAGDGGTPNFNGVAYDTVKGVDLTGDSVLDVAAKGILEGVKYDRSPSPPPNPPAGPADAGPPSGAVNFQDVLVVLAQVGLDCSQAP